MTAGAASQPGIVSTLLRATATYVSRFLQNGALTTFNGAIGAMRMSVSMPYLTQCPD